MTDKTPIELEMSELERAFETHFIQLGHDLPPYEREYAFDSKRKWQFDIAWPDHKVYVELEGGAHGTKVHCHKCGSVVLARKKDGGLGRPIRLGGAHQRRGRFISDAEKYNQAALQDWEGLRFIHDDVYGNPFAMIDQIRTLLVSRSNRAPHFIKGEMTERRIEILYFMAAGYTNDEISERLGLKMVRTHISQIHEILSVNKRASAVARAIAWGIIKVDKIPFTEELT